MRLMDPVVAVRDRRTGLGAGRLKFGTVDAVTPSALSGGLYQVHRTQKNGHSRTWVHCRRQRREMDTGSDAAPTTERRVLATSVANKPLGPNHRRMKVQHLSRKRRILFGV
jgi:hypothetical protein